jgi:methylglutaconyl-CoA hydratase
MRRSLELPREENVAGAAAMQAMFEAVDDCPKPVVVRVNGHALGGGAGLVACADVAVAVEGALIGFTEVKLGLIPAVISPYVLRAIGPGHARALFTTGARFDARRAHEIGLVQRVVPAADLDAAVAEVAGELLASAPLATALAKRLVRDATASLMLPDLPDRIATLRAGPEGQEGLRAFLDKRRPAWRD